MRSINLSIILFISFLFSVSTLAENHTQFFDAVIKSDVLKSMLKDTKETSSLLMGVTHKEYARCLDGHVFKVVYEVVNKKTGETISTKSSMIYTELNLSTKKIEVKMQTISE